jgi:glutamate-1-semialdehyde aminotransferase
MMSVDPHLLQRPGCPTRVGHAPLRIRGARGARLFDEHGRELIDLDNGKGSVLLGHADPEVAAAIEAAARGQDGAATGPGRVLGIVCERLGAHAPGGRVALFPSGGTAVRVLVQALQDRIHRGVILSAGYHGSDPCWAPAQQPFEPNPHGIVDFFFDLERLERLLDQHRGRVAAIVVSPDHIYLSERWYARARALLEAAGAPVVVDDVKQGYRLRPGCSVTMMGWTPDAIVVSKGIANGMPLAAVLGGDASLLAGCSYTALFNPVVLAAAAATLQRVNDPTTQQRIGEAGRRFTEHAARTSAAAGLPMEVHGPGQIFQLVFSTPALEERFYDVCLDEGLVLHRNDNQCPSLAFEADADEASLRLERVLTHLVDEGWVGGPPVDSAARHRAAWHVMDGLPDLEDDAATRTRHLAAVLREDGWPESGLTALESARAEGRA